MKVRNISKFYLDTYALIEIYKGNPKFEKYKEGIKIILNRLNLFEFAYVLIKEGKENDINDVFRNYSKFNADYDDEALVEAAEMKFRHLKDRLSFIDCIGYVLAKKNNAKFITGDERFRHKENVEFVK
mgnify:CR=1 FL=1